MAERNLSEAEAYRLLESAGIRVVPHRVVATADEWTSTQPPSGQERSSRAAEFGFPVVLKIASADILHKSKIGGVEIDLKTPDEVKAAFERIMANTHRAAPEAKIDGCLVSARAPRGLAEVIVGTTLDAEFGQVVMFGAGGEFAEVLKCVEFRSLPVSTAAARQMVEKIQARMGASAGWRRVDPAVPAELVRRFSELVQAHPEIVSMDINPAIVYEDRYVVVDAKGTVRSGPFDRAGARMGVVGK